MKIVFSLLCCFFTSLAFPIWAEEEVPEDPRFAELVQSFEAKRAAELNEPFEKRIAQLNGQLDLALGRYEKEAADAGDLDLVVAIKAERKLLMDDSAILPEGEGASKKIGQFREAWRKEREKLDSAMAVAEARLIDGFSPVLQELEKTLTQERKIPQALAVRKYREELIAGKSLPAALAGTDGDWKVIFDGRSLDGWKASTPNAFTLVDGGMRVRRTPQNRGMIYYVGDDSEADVFHSFEIRMRLRAEGEGANSGLFFHVPNRKLMDPKAKVGGVEVNIANGDTLMNQTGSIWDIKNVDRMLRGQTKPFELVVRVEKERLSVTSDGRTIMDYSPNQGEPPAYLASGGAIGLQANSAPNGYVFERIEIRELE